MNGDAVRLGNAALEETIPLVWGMGVRFTEVRPGYAEAELPFDGNGNHFGAMYAGALFTVGEVLGGALAMSTFDLSAHVPLVKAMTIEFLKPATSNVRASTTLDLAEAATLQSLADSQGKAEFQLVAELHDERGTLVGRTVGTYQIRRLG